MTSESTHPAAANGERPLANSQPWILELCGAVTDELSANGHCSDRDGPLLNRDLLGVFKLVSKSKAIQQVLQSIKFKATDGLKSAASSASHRALALKQMEKGKLDFALKSFNLSIVLAPVQVDSAEIETQPTVLSSAYNCRSQLLFKMKKYHECISDILHAMRRGCSDDELAELFERQAFCCEHLNEFDRAKQCCQEAIAKSENKERFLKHIIELEKKITANPDYLVLSRLHSDFSPLPWKPTPRLIKDGSNSALPAISCIVEIKSATNEKYFVAKTDIDAGNVIAVEKPYVWTLWKEHKLSHCSGCTRKCTVVTPCRGCSTVVYCSDECEESGWREYHRIECQVMPYFSSIPDFDRHRGHELMCTQIMRALSKLVYEALACEKIIPFPVDNRSACTRLSTPSHAAGDSKASLDTVMPACPVSDTASVKFRFVPHPSRNQSISCVSYLLNTATFVCVVLKLIKQVSALEQCFPTRAAGETVEDCLKQVCLTTLANLNQVLPHTGLMRHPKVVFGAEMAEDILGALLLSMSSAFSQWRQEICVAEPFAIGQTSLVSIGRAFYPSLVFFERSCYPHAIAISHGSSIVVRMVRHIHAGECLTIDRFNCSFPEDDFETRRKQMTFEPGICRCEPCLGRLSISDQVHLPTHKCSRCRTPARSPWSSKCPGCGRGVKSDRATLVRDWDACWKQLDLIKDSLPLDTPHLAARVLQAFIPADRRVAEPHMITSHSLFVRVLRSVLYVDGNTDKKHLVRDPRELL